MTEEETGHLEREEREGEGEEEGSEVTWIGMERIFVC